MPKLEGFSGVTAEEIKFSTKTSAKSDWLSSECITGPSYEHTISHCRMSLPQSWACNEDICHPVDNFRTELIRPEENFYGRWSGEQSGLQRAQSIQY